jgi:hypothetical protein
MVMYTIYILPEKTYYNAKVLSYASKMTALSLSLPQELLTCVIGWLKVLGRFSNKFLWYPNVCKQMTHTLSLSQELLTSV